MPRKQKPISRSEFIRQNINLPADQIISAGKKQGMQITKPLISYVRHHDKKKRAAKRQGQKHAAARSARKVVPTSALETHIRTHQHALDQKNPHFEELKHALGEFMVGLVDGIRAIVHEEMRANFAKLGG